MCLPTRVRRRLERSPICLFRSKNQICRRRSGSDRVCFGDVFRFCRSAVRSLRFFRSLSPKLDLNNRRKNVYYYYRWLPCGSLGPLYPSNLFDVRRICLRRPCMCMKSHGHHSDTTFLVLYGTGSHHSEGLPRILRLGIKQRYHSDPTPSVA